VGSTLEALASGLMSSDDAKQQQSCAAFFASGSVREIGLGDHCHVAPMAIAEGHFTVVQQ
jgi:hypothetical protein